MKDEIPLSEQLLSIHRDAILTAWLGRLSSEDQKRWIDTLAMQPDAERIKGRGALVEQVGRKLDLPIWLIEESADSCSSLAETLALVAYVAPVDSTQADSELRSFADLERHVERAQSLREDLPAALTWLDAFRSDRFALTTAFRVWCGMRPIAIADRNFKAILAQVWSCELKAVEEFWQSQRLQRGGPQLDLFSLIKPSPASE